MGYPADVNGAIQSSAGPLQIDDSPIPPVLTTEVTLGVNLSSTEDVTTFDATNPGATSSFQSSVTVYDSLGEAIEVDVYWEKTAAGQWSGHPMVGDIEATPKMDLAFDTSGKLTTDPAEVVVQLTRPDGSTLDVKFNFAGSTQYAEKASATTKLSQNGSQAGTFQNVTVDKDGTVLGTFSNGEEKVLGQVALARFNSDSGLRVMGGGMFASTMQSGSVVRGAPNSNGRGQIMAGALEQSTVDLATEFTNMIIAQRGYQANSRSISTADQLMQELVNLKR
jgi:flagellar hook protein FlgE